jgi:hypothetical protein
MTLRDQVTLASDNLAKWYQEHQIPQAFQDHHPMVLVAVERISGGDWRRCVTDDDGSITVYNYRVW